MKIIAVNLYGEGVLSVAGNGAVIQYVPDSPINLVNNYESTSDILISLFWDEGISNGGTVVIDYDVYFDQGSSGSGEFILLDENVVTTFYSTSVTL